VISVIIPTYNRRRLLAETLASVLAQTGVQLEVIVVDDGSTDETLAYLRTQPVIPVSLPHSGVPAVTRNAGLARARGDLVAFLDSDDLWEPAALAQLSAGLEAAPQAGFAFCDYTYFGGQASDEPQGVPAACRRSGDLFERLLAGDFLVTGSLLIRRRAIEAVGVFDARCRMAEDWDYWLRLAARFPAVYVEGRLVRLRAHHAGLSYQPGGAVYADNVLISSKMVAHCRALRPALLPLARQVHRRSVYAAARYHWRQGAHWQATGDLMRLIYAG
jgi:glycosyltransferase involved in cell wall biosynthesis